MRVMILLAAITLVACDGSADSPPVAATQQKAESPPSPVAAPPSPATAPGPGLLGLWVASRAECGGTGHYLLLREDGTARAWGHNGTWSSDVGTITLQMDPAEAMGDPGQMVEGWIATMTLRVIDADEMILTPHKGEAMRLYRCPG